MELDKVEVMRRLAAQAAAKVVRCRKQLEQAEAEQEAMDQSLAEAQAQAKAEKASKK